MRIKNLSFLVLIFFFISCNGSKKKEEVELVKEDEKALVDEKKTLNLVGFADVFDTNFIGMEATENNKLKKDYEKYAVDFTGACYSSDLLKMKITKKSILISNYYDSKVNVILLINEIDVLNDTLIIKTKPKACFKISKIKKLPIYSFLYEGENYPEIRMSKFISKESNIKLFGGIDCGDFDG